MKWQIPRGFSVGELRYPVPERLTIAGLMNYVYEKDYAILTRLKVPANASGIVPIRAKARWLACTDKVCVPESGSFALDLPVGTGTPNRARFDEWRRALPRPLASTANFEIDGNRLKLGIPLPENVKVEEPYVFPVTGEVVDYAGKQSFSRSGDVLIAELPLKVDPPGRFSAVLALGDGRGLAFDAIPGDVPKSGSPIAALGS
ncbi:MAG: protein-disulfide reductase DsbD domain-containing protein, partial [Alphaproteobacteria bacterium]